MSAKNCLPVGALYFHIGVRIGVRARGAEGAAAPPDSGKTIIFRAKAKFFGQKPVGKMKKKYFLVIY